jgi:tetratricopeptide (TPR) repeat protein/predicted Ser/Thr protein kinase
MLVIINHQLSPWSVKMGTPKPHPECLQAFEVGFRDPEEGLRLLDGLLAREPHAFGAFNVYGQLSLKTGDLATARDAFQKNIAAWPDADHRCDWAYLGLIAGILGDETEARACSAKGGATALQQDFRNSVRQAYFARLNEKGRTPSRLAAVAAPSCASTAEPGPAPSPAAGPAHSVFCSSCGFENAAESSFCINCGAARAPGQSSIPSPEELPPAVMPPAKPCPSCSSENSLESAFCIECGRPLHAPAPAPPAMPDAGAAPLQSESEEAAESRAARIPCPACSLDNEPGDAFCRHCGALLMPEAGPPVRGIPASPVPPPHLSPEKPGSREPGSKPETPDAAPAPQPAPPEKAVPPANPLPPLPPAAPSDSSMTATLRVSRKEFGTGSMFADRYQIVEELGQGGMGRVYRALDKKVNEEVAIKVVRPEISSEPRIIERFSNELRNARGISHKNICRMYDLFESDGLHFITMEYVPGENLKSFIRRSRRLAVGTAVAIAKQVAEGLDEAHRRGVVHRDLKSQNIMIDREGNVRIMDFGIASSVKTKGMTVQGVMIGTPDYMAPEQVEGREADARADIYALGVVLFEMLTGRLPFEGDTPLSVAVKHKSLQPPDPASLNPHIPDDLRRLILRCLEKDRDRRYSSAGAVWNELHRIEEGVPTAERGVPEPAGPAAMPEPTAAARPRRRLLPALAASVLVLGALAVWYFVLRPGEGKQAAPAGSTTPAVPTAESDSSPARNALSRGLRLLSEHDFAEALAAFRETMSLEPSNRDAIMGAALALKGQGRLGEALEEFLKAVRLDPSDPRPYEHLGDIHAERGETAQALESYAGYLERAPLGEATDLVRDKAEMLKITAGAVSPLAIDATPAPAREKSEPARAGKPEPVAAPDVSGLLARGIEAFHEKDYEGSIRQMQLVLRLDPENQTARRYLAEAPLFLAAETAFQEGRWEDCLAEARKILVLSPSNAQAVRLEEMAWQKLAPARIKAAVDGFVQATNGGRVLSFYESTCSPALFQRIKREIEIVNSLYGECQTQASQVTIRFPERGKAEVRFTNITTGLMKPENKRRVVFEGTYVWTMERREDDWLIVGIQSLPSRK